MRADVILRWAAVLGGTAVIFGAFGAHALAARLSAGALASYQTGVLYQFIHALALLAWAVWVEVRYQGQAQGAGAWVGRLWILGVFLFSGSIYLLATREILGTQALAPILGPITPLGGLCFIGGWLALLWSKSPKRA